MTMRNQLLNLTRSLVHRGRLVNHALRAPILARQSYSQCGEDVILQFALQSLGIFKPRYLDIGAHHPLHLSNSALFYQTGGRGVNVEPNPVLFREFVQRRPQDVNLNVGVGRDSATLDFYVMDNPEMSTFSREIADEYVRQQGLQLREVIPVPVLPINEILERHATAHGFDVLSLDVEGLDEEILSALDYSRFAPLAICVETVDFATGEKRVETVGDLLKPHGYFSYADTYINTIFFHESRFRTLRSAMVAAANRGGSSSC